MDNTQKKPFDGHCSVDPLRIAGDLSDYQLLSWKQPGLE